MADQLGDELEGRFEALGGDLDPGRHAVPARLGVEARPKPFRRLDEGDGIVVLGPLGEGAGRQDRRAGLGGRLVDRAVAEQEGGTDERSTWHGDRDEGKAVGQPLALEGREDVGPRFAGGRPSADDDVGHAADLLVEGRLVGRAAVAGT